MNYRSVYKLYHGEIPLDENGRHYDIHHIDGNRENNNIRNLVALKIEDHYDVHYTQGDYAACISIQKRMDQSPLTISELSSMREKQLVAEGTHRFLGGDLQRKKIAEGRHHFLDKEWQARKEREKAKKGRHPFQKTVTCDRCGREMRLCNIEKHKNGKRCQGGIL